MPCRSLALGRVWVPSHKCALADSSCTWGGLWVWRLLGIRHAGRRQEVSSREGCRHSDRSGCSHFDSVFQPGTPLDATHRAMPHALSVAARYAPVGRIRAGGGADGAHDIDVEALSAAPWKLWVATLSPGDRLALHIWRSVADTTNAFSSCRDRKAAPAPADALGPATVASRAQAERVIRLPRRPPAPPRAAALPPTTERAPAHRSAGPAYAKSGGTQNRWLGCRTADTTGAHAGITHDAAPRHNVGGVPADLLGIHAGLLPTCST